ncbi:MAG: hypothetical protein C0596_12210 [Marinilabiliales bacterium]|nr:MAG: hypothetical protein C0596_12210 [Marinilabiliales bacterium]
MEAATRESADVYTKRSMSDTEIVEYNNLNMKSVEFAKAKNKDEFVKTRVLIHEKEFDLFPERHGPKGKQASFRKRYLEFYKAMYEETATDEYFERAYINPPATSTDNLKYTVENGVVKYTFDEAFFTFIDENIKILKDGVETSMNSNALQLHPEYEVVKNSDLMFKMSVGAMAQAFGTDGAEAIFRHLGMEDEMIEITDANIEKMNCVVCNTELDVPEGSKSVMCVECGCKNEVTAGQIACPNCSAPFDPVKENETCPYCSSKIERPKSMHDFMKDKYADAMNTSKPKKKKGLFGRLFG